MTFCLWIVDHDCLGFIGKDISSQEEERKTTQFLTQFLKKNPLEAHLENLLKSSRLCMPRYTPEVQPFNRLSWVAKERSSALSTTRT